MGDVVDLATLPSRRDEGWRWSDLRAAVGDEPTPRTDTAGYIVGKSVGGVEEKLSEQKPFVFTPFGAHEIGTFPRGTEATGQRIELETLRSGAKQISPFVQTATGMTSVLDIRETVECPIILDMHVFEQQRVAFRLKTGVSVTIVDNPVVPSQGFVPRLIDIEVEEGGTLDWVTLAPAADGVYASLTGVHLAKDATFSQTSLTMGAKLARLETHVNVNGPGAEVKLNGVSLLSGSRHGDHTTFVTHNAPDATTREVFRTVACDAARGVFQGKIKVDRLAQKTDAEMHHAALILGENASVNANPELEIYADDVACAHGNTCGELDLSALFYMRQRGLPEARAKALLTRAFIGEALDGVANEGVRAILDAQVDAWLEANL